MRKISTKVALLPPDCRMIETLPVLRKEAEARQLLSELKGFAHTIPNQNILISAISLHEAKESSAIENIVTTHDKLYKHIVIKSANIEPSAKEVINYREAIYKGADIIKKRDLLSVSDIIKIQEIIAENNAGIRKLPGTSLVNALTQEIIYIPPQDYDEICYLLSNFCEYLNNGESSLWKMAVLHYQFEIIHPFYDGNGRTGRIINVLYLLLKNYLDTPILYLSSYIIRNKDRYYALFQEVKEKNIWENWVLYILDGIEKTSKQALEKTRSIKILLEFMLDEIKKKCPKIYSKELVEIIFENPYAKIDFLVSKLNINRKTASKYLKALESNGFLSYEPVGRDALYVNHHLMKILKTDAVPQQRRGSKRGQNKNTGNSPGIK